MEKSIYLRQLLSSYNDLSNLISPEERSKEIKKIMNLSHGKKQRSKNKNMKGCE